MARTASAILNIFRRFREPWRVVYRPVRNVLLEQFIAREFKDDVFKWTYRNINGYRKDGDREILTDGGNNHNLVGDGLVGDDLAGALV